MINVFVYETIKRNYLEDKQKSLITQGDIIAGIASNIDNYDEQGIDYITTLEKKIERLKPKVEGRILIVNKDKKIIYDSLYDLKGSILEQKEVTQALKGQRIVDEYILKNYGHVMYAAVPIGDYEKIEGAVFFSSTLKDVYKNINNIKYHLILISLSILLVITFFSIFIANSISEPINRLTVAMQKAAYGKLNEKVEITRDDEIGRLARSYNFMSTKLTQIDKQRREFVSNVSHELKTPLSSMKLLAESLLTQPQVDLEIYKEFLKDINSEIDRLNMIIESLLNMVDLDEKKLNLDYEITYVNYLLERVVNSLRPLADQKNVELILNQGEKMQIYLDQGKIHQALTNLIHNAVKYTEKNGKVVVDLYRQGKMVIIEIGDNGIGIPEESLPYIFDRFYRVDSARSRKTGGSGLGLAISQQIVQLHQGMIEVESVVNQGTTFYVKLPMDHGKGREV